MFPAPLASVLFFFNDTATTEIYTLSLHDALPISDRRADAGDLCGQFYEPVQRRAGEPPGLDRKSTRLNSSHLVISYAVFCLKKKKNKTSKIIRRTNTTIRRRFAADRPHIDPRLSP